jgi:hypothetical protein
MDNFHLSPEEIRAAAEVHHELGPDYSDAVVASFLAKLDREIAARVDARLAAVIPARGGRVARSRSAVTPSSWSSDGRRGLMRGMAIGFGAATIPLLWFWDLGSRSADQNAGRALVVLGFMAITVTCAVRGFGRRGRRGTPISAESRQP